MLTTGMSANDLAACSASVFTFQLQDLPNEAVELIAQHASTPSTPAACLLPLVCQGWRAAADRAQLWVDVSVDLTPAYRCLFESDEWELQLSMAHAGGEAAAAVATAAAASPAAAVPAIPSGLLRAGRLAAWLARNSGRLRSLRIPETHRHDTGPAWAVHLRGIRDALTAGQGGDAGPPLPHLVQLELPIMNTPGTGTFLVALSSTCPSLQHLVLKEGPDWRYGRGVPYGRQPDASRPNDLPMLGTPISMELMARALAPLTCLRVLRMLWTPAWFRQGSSMPGLLRALPATLEELQMFDYQCNRSIPVSCITHLVNLRCWEQTWLGELVEDSSSSSSSSSSSGAAALKALTRLSTCDTLYSEDARLQLPRLRALVAIHIEPTSWQQLRCMKHLRQLTTSSFSSDPGRNGEPPLQGDQGAAGLGGMTQLQQLELIGSDSHQASASWAASVAELTALTALQLDGDLVVAGGAALLAPLTQLQALTVDCFRQLSQEYYPDGAEGWAATPAGAVVQAVAEAVQGGRGQLQRLVLQISEYEEPWQHSGQQVHVAAMTALPRLEVEVQEWDDGCEYTIVGKAAA